MHNTDVLFREDVTIDQLIDCIIGNRHYVPCLYCYNKIDQISLEEVDRLARMPNTVVISVEMDLNLETLKSRIWEGLGLNRVYTKRKGVKPDLSDPVIVKKDATIEQVVSSSILNDSQLTMISSLRSVMPFTNLSRIISSMH